ncbi:MAG: HlyD family efflux transporter periplasmic adaptor subunit [Gammaproteobacteria bacterium]
MAQSPAEAEPQPPADNGDRRSQALATFLQLEREARHAITPQAFRFVVVNETRRLIRYDQAVLWKLDSAGRARVEAVSGIAEHSREAPYIHWLENMIARQLRLNTAGQRHVITHADVGSAEQADWNEWIGGEVLWLPLLTARGEIHGGLWLIRAGSGWQAGEQALLERLADAYAHAWQALERHAGRPLIGTGGRSGLRRYRLWLAAALVLVLLLPVRQSALAPAEIIPLDPVIVTAPLEGVIRAVHVQPNSAVHKGDLLFSLDDTTLRNKHEVALKAAGVAQAEYLRAAQKAFKDESSKSELAMLRAQVALRDAEARYTGELLDKVDVHAVRDGIAIFTAVNDWLGKPVIVGEKVITLADPAQTEIQLWLPVDDAISLETGAEVKLFLNTDPTRPLKGTLRQTSYEPQVTAAGNLAFQLKARLDTTDTPPRVGLKGTGKIYGNRVLLISYLLRRPISALRRFTGF